MGQETVKGMIENVIFQNAENGFTVFSLEKSEENSGSLVCVGIMPKISVGEYLKVTGSYVNHATYGVQLKIEQFEKSLPDDEQSIEKYLGSGIIKGVRERLAKKIVKKFGKNTLTILEEYPEMLAEIKGITIERAQEICAIFHEQAEQRRVIMYLQDQGISFSYANKLYKRYRGATIEIVKENPYVLAEEIDGIGFKTADSIAFKLGMPKESSFRINSGVKYLLMQATGNGHTYLPKDILINDSAELLEVDGSLISNALSELQMQRTLWQENIDGEICVYLNYYYYAESYVAKKLLELSKTVIDKSGNVESEIASIEKATGILLAENQKNAVGAALKHGVFVITGGPGTGKTTTIRTIISVLEMRDYKVELAAPTGRAAKRMSEATGKEAKTIHRMLEISFEDDSRHQIFGKNEDTPLETDVLIVDETSMVDVSLMCGLLKALSIGTRLILVGDVDQLPSVGAGNILKDIIQSNCIEVILLDEIFRQARESAIIMNAHRINKGEYPLLNEKEKDFFFVKRNTPELVIESILELVSTRLPKYIDGDAIKDIQVLTPMRKSALGILSLNKVLQEKLNPPAKNKREKELRNVIFREGDKVMQIKNNYNIAWRTIDKTGRQIDEGLGIFNGDVGVIRSINEYDEKLTVLFDDTKLVDYDFSRTDELELAYAITIHKSQGSEYRAVIMPIHSGPPMLMSRNLLYTGITRAKELAVIVGVPETLNRMVDNNREISRFTSLSFRLKKLNKFINGDI